MHGKDEQTIEKIIQALSDQILFADREALAQSCVKYNAPFETTFLSTQNGRPFALSASEDRKDVPSVAVFKIEGPIFYSENAVTKFFGFPTYQGIQANLKKLVADSSVKSIIMQIQSPGGMAIGCQECSKFIYDLRSEKRIVSFADPYAFSAAFDLATAASEFYVMPSGQVGSVGSYIMHADYSGALKEAGIDVTFISAGEKKVDGNPYQPLSKSARADLQKDVDFYYEAFVESVARNRAITAEDVRQNYGKGGRVLAKDALQAGMVDDVITFEQLILRELSALSEESPRARNAAFTENAKLFLEIEEL